MSHTITKPDKAISGEVTLVSSKSITNRLLVMQALYNQNNKTGDRFSILNSSTADDSVLLQKLLCSESMGKDACNAGTVMRFLLAYFSLLPGNRVLTGNERMRQRPVGGLVDVLRRMGAEILCLEKEGYPPLQVRGGSLHGGAFELHAGVSSQFVTALLLIAPYLKEGLKLNLTGNVISSPYIDMSIGLMNRCGAKAERRHNELIVYPGSYRAGDYEVEPDWSSASYWYEIAALSASAAIFLPGLKKDSLQGDAVIADIMESFGVSTVYEAEGVRLISSGNPLPERVLIDLSGSPDLAPTVAVTAAGLGIEAELSGLSHLKLKESDRMRALITELRKIGVKASEKDPGILQIAGIVGVQNFEPQRGSMKVYQDHRLAMAFAPLAMVLGKIDLEEMDVVSKSYPGFREDMQRVGFKITRVAEGSEKAGLLSQ